MEFKATPKCPEMSVSMTLDTRLLVPEPGRAGLSGQGPLLSPALQDALPLPRLLRLGGWVRAVSARALQLHQASRQLFWGSYVPPLTLCKHSKQSNILLWAAESCYCLTLYQWIFPTRLIFRKGDPSGLSSVSQGFSNCRFQLLLPIYIYFLYLLYFFFHLGDTPRDSSCEPTMSFQLLLP